VRSSRRWGHAVGQHAEHGRMVRIAAGGVIIHELGAGAGARSKTSVVNAKLPDPRGSGISRRDGSPSRRKPGKNPTWRSWRSLSMRTPNTSRGTERRGRYETARSGVSAYGDGGDKAAFKWTTQRRPGRQS